MRLSQKVNYEQWQPFYWQRAVLVLWYFNCTAKKKSPMSLDISKSQEMTVANLTHSSREGVFSVTLPYPASAHRLRRCHRWVVGNAVTHVCYSVQVSYMTNVTRPFKARARTCAGCWEYTKLLWTTCGIWASWLTAREVMAHTCRAANRFCLSALKKCKELHLVLTWTPLKWLN